MSGQGSQRFRKSSPCSSSKQGPMRATLPMSSLLRQGSNLRKSKSNSPTLSPTSAWKTVISPDASMSGQRSPGSLSYKGTGTLFKCQNNNVTVLQCPGYIREEVFCYNSAFDSHFLPQLFHKYLWLTLSLRIETKKVYGSHR
jgi:hypothetical protein